MCRRIAGAWTFGLYGSSVMPSETKQRTPKSRSQLSTVTWSRRSIAIPPSFKTRFTSTTNGPRSSQQKKSGQPRFVQPHPFRSAVARKRDSASFLPGVFPIFQLRRCRAARSQEPLPHGNEIVTWVVWRFCGSVAAFAAESQAGSFIDRPLPVRPGRESVPRLFRAAARIKRPPRLWWCHGGRGWSS